MLSLLFFKACLSSIGDRAVSTRDGPIPHFCRYTDMPIPAFADTRILDLAECKLTVPLP